MLALTRDRLEEVYQRALSMPQPDQVISLEELNFAGRYPIRSDWRIGPFETNEALTFRPTADWEDPVQIGWRATSIFNPTLLPVDDTLHMFYRAAPRMETLSSRIGHARYTRDAGWVDNTANPTLYPTLDNELLGCEDPKIYAAEGRYFLFYNGGWAIDSPEAAEAAGGLFSPDIGCDINLAVSDDLLHWTKLGQAIPHSVTGYWAKGAVIPRDRLGNAVRVNGEYLMYISEGCFGQQLIGRSQNMMDWTFTPHHYLDVDPGGTLHEVACVAVRPELGCLVMDYFFGDSEGTYRAAQARYSLDEPLLQLANEAGGSLAWGGLVEFEGKWTFAQGWDAPRGDRAMYFYQEAAES